MPKEEHPMINTNMLDFLRKNVYSVTEITCQKKLSEILDLYSDKVTDEVFVIQNGKKKMHKQLSLILNILKSY